MYLLVIFICFFFISVHFCLFLSVSVRCCPFLSVSVSFFPFLSVSVGLEICFVLMLVSAQVKIFVRLPYAIFKIYIGAQRLSGQTLSRGNDYTNIDTKKRFVTSAQTKDPLK